MRNLPLGISDFSTIRNPSRNFIYINKTAQIAEMVRMFPAVFIARPRRFGKSLLASTLRDLFGKGIEGFEGLDIAKTWTDTTYKVVSLDFSAFRDVGTLEDFLLAFDLHLQGRLRAAGIETSPDVSRFPLQRWETALLSLPNSSLVLLIDEYDAPLTECLHLPERFEQYRRVIASFFARTKSLSGALRFLCVTGVMKFKQNVLTPSFNALTDLSMMPQYGSLLGFTEDELRTNFSTWLERASDLCGMSHDQLISRMRREYGGFCFDQNASTDVFAPWSVLQFLACPQPDFQHYGLNPGGTTAIVRNFLKVRGLLDPAHYDEPFLEDLTVIAGDDPILELQPTSVLVHTGYLTIKKATGDGAVMLGYPNEEVREAMGNLCSLHR